MRASLNREEFTKWKAFDRISPLYPERGDLHAAQIAWAVATFLPMGRKGPSPKMEDFILRFEPPAVQVDQKALRVKGEVWLSMLQVRNENQQRQAARAKPKPDGRKTGKKR